MSIFEAIILGLIQGLTEFIPVSSSGHLLLAHEVFGSEGSTISFDVALHVGTLIALLIFFRTDILVLLKNVFQGNKDGRLARLLAMATVPGVVFGLLFNGYIEDTLRSPTVVALALASVALLMLFADARAKKSKDVAGEVAVKQGMTIGFAQALALIPGVSRSGITITTGMFMGLGRVQAARFSFLLAIPIVAGSALGIVVKGGDGSSVGAAPLVVGMVVSFISGFFAIRFLLGVIARVGLRPFAYYRIALAVIVLVAIA